MFPKALGAREVKLVNSARVLLLLLPQGGAPALALEPAEAVEASSRGEEAWALESGCCCWRSCW